MSCEKLILWRCQ